MSTTLPYTAPYSRSRPQARPTPQVDRRLAVIVASSLAGLLLFAMLQLWLASEVASTLKHLAVLEQEKSDLLSTYDALLIRGEELKSPSLIETRAIKEKLVPLPVDFVP